MTTEILRAIWLGLVSGTADAAGWMGSGVFPAHMTGNTALLGVALLQGRWHLFRARAATIGCFFCGLLLSASLRDRFGTTTAIVVAALFAVFAATIHAPADVLPLAVALAMQNAALRRFAGQAINTSFLTGDLQGLAASLARRLRGAAEDRDKDRVVLRIVPSVWCAYVVGAALGAALAGWLRHPLLPVSLAIPVALLLLGRGAARA